MKLTKIQILAGFLALSSLAMAAYIFFIYERTTSAAPTPVSIPSPALPAANPGRAFIKISDAMAKVERGASWNLKLETNSWGTCLIDLYQPGEKIFPQKKEDAKAVFVAPGKFTWAWTAPQEAALGTWVARVLCGTYDNLATADQAFEVK